MTTDLLSKRTSNFGPLALAALGVVYGDIGTSPIYTLRESLNAAGGTADWPTVAGLLSLMFWLVTAIVSIKYASLVLRADNQGQGGMLALVALALQRTRTSGGRRVLIILGMAGASFFLGDAVITPAISVLSAVEGLQIAAPALQRWVLPLTIAIIIALFAVQSRGTGSVGRLFGPIVLVWFAVLAALGAVEIVRNPGILLALNPSYGLAFAVAHPASLLIVLGSVLLAVTGAEALYADLGHFGRKPIQFSWFMIVLPASMISYFGQGALVLRNPAAAADPFFLLAPHWFLLPLIVIAMAATIIASQAVISGAFSLGYQSIRLGLIPRLRIAHTSADQVGQIYIPQINWLLMVLVIGLVIGFGSSSALANAYGIAVVSTMLINSLVAALVFRRNWDWPLWKMIAVIAPILLIEATLLAASSLKIVHGGWFSLSLALALYLVMLTWHDIRGAVERRRKDSALTDAQFLRSLSMRHLQRVPGAAMFLTADTRHVPSALLHNMRHNQVLHETVILASVTTEQVPVVPDDQRVELQELGNGFFRLIARFGFAEEPDLPRTLRQAAAKQPMLDPDRVSFFVGRERLVSGLRSRIDRWRRALVIFLSNNESSAADYFHIPLGRIIELGQRSEI
ncbi:MAG: potassium transporter Kup [Dongiaceae bacterium]